MSKTNSHKLIKELNTIVDQIRSQAGLEPLDHRAFINEALHANDGGEAKSPQAFDTNQIFRSAQMPQFALPRK